MTGTPTTQGTAWTTDQSSSPLDCPTGEEIRFLRKRLDIKREGRVVRAGAVTALVSGSLLPSGLLQDSDGGVDSVDTYSRADSIALKGVELLFRVSNNRDYARHWAQMIQGWRVRHGNELTMYK